MWANCQHVNNKGWFLLTDAGLIHTCGVYSQMHTHSYRNNIRVGGDFKGWLTLGWASACLWVQLGPLTFCSPIKAACCAHTWHHCCILLVFAACGLSELCGNGGCLRCQMFDSVACFFVFFWTRHLAVVWVMVCGAVAWRRPAYCAAAPLIKTDPSVHTDVRPTRFLLRVDLPFIKITTSLTLRPEVSLYVWDRPGYRCFTRRKHRKSKCYDDFNEGKLHSGIKTVRKWTEVGK